MITTITTIAIFLYLVAATYQARYLLGKNAAEPSRPLLIGMGIIAATLHGVSIFFALNVGEHIDLGFFKVASIIFCFITALSITSTLRRPTDNLLVAAFPLAALSMLAATTSSPAHTLSTSMTPGMLTHIICSILAFSILSIAAIQAAALGLQVHQLKHRHTIRILRALPPLQTMEIMLFELIWMGVILLSLSILTGTLFIEDIFAQHLAHKSVLTIAALIIFTILLWGRYQLGWRSQTAVRWTIGGFIALMLGYFGSKLVLEIILLRG